MVQGYGFGGRSPGGVAADGISTTTRTCAAGRPHGGICRTLLVNDRRTYAIKRLLETSGFETRRTIIE